MNMPQNLQPFYLRQPGAQQQPEEEPEQRQDAAPAQPPQQQAAGVTLPKLPNIKNWLVWISLGVVGAALVALLMSLKSDDSHEDGISDFMFDRWLSSAFRDEDDDRPRSRRRSRDDDDDRGWKGYIPPIIINNPGQQPHVLGGNNTPNGGN